MASLVNIHRVDLCWSMNGNHSVPARKIKYGGKSEYKWMQERSGVEMETLPLFTSILWGKKENAISLAWIWLCWGQNVSTLQAPACLCADYIIIVENPSTERAFSFSLISYIIQANDIFVCDYLNRTKRIFTVLRMSIQQLCTKNGRLC